MMFIAQEIIPVDSLIEAGIVTILGIAIVLGIVSFFYMLRLFRNLLDSFRAQDTNQDETTVKLVTLTSDAIRNNEQFSTVVTANTAAIDRNTGSFESLAEALTSFRAGIETKVEENTDALHKLADEVRHGKISLEAVSGLVLPILLPDGSKLLISVIKEEDGSFMIKVEKPDEHRSSPEPE